MVHDRLRDLVTVPVRGIRLHLKYGVKGNSGTIVTVPVRGIRLHPLSSVSGTSVTVPVRGIRLHP